MKYLYNKYCIKIYFISISNDICFIKYIYIYQTSCDFLLIEVLSYLLKKNLLIQTQVKKKSSNDIQLN